MKKLLLLPAIIVMFTACQKEHSEYRFTPKFHVSQLVQYEKSIQRDMGRGGKRLWDVPQPLRIDSVYYNETWRDNWYIYTDASGKGRQHEVGIDELQLQAWNGTLQK